jgi:hypothetical protein
MHQIRNNISAKRKDEHAAGYVRELQVHVFVIINRQEQGLRDC